MQKQIILFDIDKTLLNTKKLSEEFILPNLAQKFGFSKAEVDRLFLEYKLSLDKHTDFNPEDLATFLANKVDQKEIGQAQILDILYQVNFFSESLFPEVIPILDELSVDFSLGIFSEGFESWQSKKLDRMGIKSYFEQDLVFIERRKTTQAVLEKLPEEVIIVDDNTDVIEDLLDFGKFTPIWINRMEDELLFEGVFQIETLFKLPAILASFKTS